MTRAARFHDWGASPVVEDVPEPAYEPGRVLVEVKAAALNHLDLTVATGSFAMKPALPYVGGVEASGVVLAADDAADDAAGGLAPGTQVLLRGGGLGLLRDGCWTERVSVSPKAVSPLAAPLPHEVAASFFVPATTAYVALHDIARLEPGEEVVVAGAAGAVGAMVAQQARLAGATVTGLVGRSDQLDRVPEGVRAVAADDAAAVAELASARSASLLVDTLGGAGLVERTRWVRPGGRAVVIGYVLGASVTVDLPSWLLDDVALLPVNMVRHERRAREVAPSLVGRLASGELGVEVERFDLSEIAEALESLRAGRVRGRAVVTFG
ncbi:alcohol dehydrogenase catalytic domain-containing protein [Nonomuraea sp. NPDC050153]|uniref:alcohol dehydrogenase catalytic domain-containing protein n=1 Tax=Nonomuraea sp. NPDC050153 TaxID=3364359 RepID=UPI00379AD8D9